MRISRDAVCVLLGAAAGGIASAIAGWLCQKRAAVTSGPPTAPSTAEALPLANGLHAAPEPQHGLILERPLITFDLESTGLDVGRDRIVEIAAVKLLPDGQVVIKGPQRINPGMQIPQHVTELHGISNADLADAPRWKDVAEEWAEFLKGCDLHGYNAKKFDVPMLRSELRRAGIFNVPALGAAVVDSFRIFAQFEQRNLTSALRFFCGKQLDGAHGALADAQAALDVLQAQVMRYPTLPRRVSQLAAWCGQPQKAGDATWDGRMRWQNGELMINFGRHQNTALRVLAAEKKDYLMWMKGQDFSDEVLIFVELALQNKLPANQQAWEAMLEDGSWLRAIATEPIAHDWGV